MLVEFAKRNWLFLLPLVVFAGYYGVQNVFGFLFYPYDMPLTFLIALAFSVGSYILAYEVIPVGWAERVSVAEPVIPDTLLLLIVASFFAVVFLSCITTDHIPLLESLNGASAPDLAGYRNDFLRTRTGGGQILNYAFAILSQSLMPLAMAYAFWSKANWRWIALGIFALGAAITLSKAAFFLIACPLVAVFLMQRRWLPAAATVVSFMASIALMYVLASGILGSWQAKIENVPVPTHQVEMPSDVPAQYNAFASKNPVLLVANRIVWIPYATAIDWFRYQKEVLGGNYVLGQSIGPVAFLMGEKRVSLEKEVANFEWGDGAGNTSNAVFFADAWLNFGLIGVVLYSALLAMTIKIISRSGYPPLMAASVLPIWIACFSPLPPVYFSGGLGFLLLLSLVIRGQGSELDDRAVHVGEAARSA